MAGKLKLWSAIKPLAVVRKYLFPTETSTVTSTDSAYSWDSDWGWEDVDINDDESESECSWFNACQSSISPTGEIMVFARQKRMVILSYKFEEDKTAVPSMKVHYSGEPANIYEDETITSVLCVPLYSPRQSNHGAPDWTCIVVGFASGCIRFYSDNGGEILSQKLHNSAVQRIRLQTYEPMRPGLCGEQQEELLLLYSNVLVCIEGFSLFQTLRACRNHLARATAGSSAPLVPPPLSFHKWALRQQEGVTDQISLGLRTATTFDNLVTASQLGGPYATVQPAAPTHCVYAAIGRKPFIGFYFAAENGWQPMLTDVARLVANKVKTAIVSTAMSWLGGRTTTTTTTTSSEDTERKLEQAVALSVRYGLPDKRREAVSIAVAPNHLMSAVVDTFGRVLLVDLLRGVALRMWKGYRDAQVAWMEAEEEAGGTSLQRTQRNVSFLVIYAPRRGILEVWAAEQGPRVAAFNVGKGGRLYAIEYKMLGLNAATHRNVIGQRHNQPLFSAMFLDREGHLSMLDVPFHLCLTDRSSHRAHDYHLLKQLRRLVRESNAVAKEEELLEGIISLIREFRLVGFMEQAVERILNTTYLSVGLLEQIFKELTTELEAGQFCKMSPALDKQRLILYGQTVLSLMTTFSTIQALSFHREEEEEEEEEMMGAAAATASKSTAEILRPHLPDEWSAENLARLAKVLDFNDKFARTPHNRSGLGKQPTKAATVCCADVTVIQFLSWFYTQFQGKKELGSLQREVLINSDISTSGIIAMGSFFFRSHLIGYTTGEDLLSTMQKSCIPREAFLNAFLAFYLSEHRHVVSNVDWLAALLQQLLHFKAEESVASSEEVARLLETLEREVKMCKKRGAPLFLTLAVISVLRSEIRSREKVDHEGVAALTALLPQWMHLLRRIEDAMALQLLLAHRPVDDSFLDAIAAPAPPPPPCPSAALDRRPTIPGFSRVATTTSLTLDSGSAADFSVSQVRLAEGGRGFVTELTARWATRWRLTLADLQCLYMMLSEKKMEVEEKEEEKMEVDQQQQAVVKQESVTSQITTEALFACLYDHFPLALEIDSLLANVAWEYIFLWSRDQEEVSLFSAAIDCLRHLGPGGALVCHGVASMAWHMHIQKVVQCAAYLIEKIGGKAPKDRLCRKETNMSQACLKQFLHCSFLFMETFKQANCDADVVPAFIMDQSWRSGVDGRLSLVELAIDQPLTNYGLLLHHSILIFCLDAIVRFDIRGFKPFGLFDQRGISAFFKSMTSHPLLPGTNLDTPVATQRSKFVTRVLEEAVMALAKGATDTHTFYRDSLVNQLAPHMGLESDLTRREHIGLLYSYGLDTVAEEYLPAVKDTTVMASQLLLIAGQRCAQLVFSADGQLNLQLMALMPPVLEGYFRTSNYKDLAESKIPVSATQRLVSVVIQLMTDDHPELHRAHLIADTLERFANTGEFS